MPTTSRTRHDARAAQRRRRAPRHKPQPPMGVFAAIATVGADHAAHALGADSPFGRACRERIDETLGPERTAWRALALHGPSAVRDALAAQHVFVFLDYDRHED